MSGVTYRAIAGRHLTTDTHPDHDPICAFRRNNLEAAAFRHVLELARELKRLKLGTVSLDGTHIRANASKDKNVTYERAQQLCIHLRQDINVLLQQAKRTDQQDEGSQALPQEIARREELLQKMEAACACLEQRARERAAAAHADYESKIAARQAREGSAKGPQPKPPQATRVPDEQINLHRSGRAPDAQEQTRRLHPGLQRAGRGGR